MAESDLAHLPQPLPEFVVVTNRTGARLTPNEIRLLKQETGRTMEELYGESADEGDKMQTLAWLGLRRMGHDRVRWNQCGDVAVEFRIEDADPTQTDSSTTSPGSAGSGE